MGLAFSRVREITPDDFLTSLAGVLYHGKIAQRTQRREFGISREGHKVGALSCDGGCRVSGEAYLGTGVCHVTEKVAERRHFLH